MRRIGGIFLAGILAATGVAGLAADPAHAAVDPTTVTVQGGTTPTDTGLLQAVFEPLFKLEYPQYNLKYVSVGTGAAITNAEQGGGDVVLTHSPALEDTFVKQGYSYEPGGRLVMTSDFETVGPPSDPAGVATGPGADVVAAFREIAAAGNAGKAEFISRGDASGTNTKEESIWKLTGIPVNKSGDPVVSAGSTTNPSWYHKTGKGQGDNLVFTNQCAYPSGACYTFTDTGTFNAVTANGSVTNLKVVSSQNNAPTAQGGADLLANPYHAYAVNPAKEPDVNLPGALAFLNFLTSPATQQAMANYPKPSAPAFVPDATPEVTVAGFPQKQLTANSPVLLTGTVKARFPLDPPLPRLTLELFRADDLSTVLAETTTAADGSWGMAFRPSHAGAYVLFVPQSLDGLVEPTNTSYRQAETLALGTLDAVGSASITKHTAAGTRKVRFSGSSLGGLTRKSPGITLQVRKGTTGAWHTASKRDVLGRGKQAWSITATFGSAGKWQVRAVYTDPGIVNQATSKTVTVTVA